MANEEPATNPGYWRGNQVAGNGGIAAFQRSREQAACLTNMVKMPQTVFSTVLRPWAAFLPPPFQKWGTKMRKSLCLRRLPLRPSATPAFAQQASAQAEARGVVLRSLTLSRSTISTSARWPATPSSRERFRWTPTPASVRRRAVLWVCLGPSAAHALMVSARPPKRSSWTPQPAWRSARQRCQLDRRSAQPGRRRPDAHHRRNRRIHRLLLVATCMIVANQTAGLYSANFDLTADYQ